MGEWEQGGKHLWVLLPDVCTPRAWPEPPHSPPSSTPNASPHQGKARMVAKEPQKLWGAALEGQTPPA